MRQVIARLDAAPRRGGRMAGLRALAGAALMPLFVGCYSYAPIRTSSAPREGDELRVELTSEGTQEITRYLGPRVTALDATLVRVDPDSTFVLRVIALRFVDGTSYPFSGEDPVPVSHSLIASTERRTLSPSRTVVASAGLVAGLIAVASAALHTGHVAPGGGPSGPPPP